MLTGAPHAHHVRLPDLWLWSAPGLLSGHRPFATSFYAAAGHPDDRLRTGSIRRRSARAAPYVALMSTIGNQAMRSY